MVLLTRAEGLQKVLHRRHRVLPVHNRIEDLFLWLRIDSAFFLKSVIQFESPFDRWETAQECQ